MQPQQRLEPVCGHHKESPPDHAEATREARDGRPGKGGTRDDPRTQEQRAEQQRKVREETWPAQRQTERRTHDRKGQTNTGVELRKVHREVNERRQKTRGRTQRTAPTESRAREPNRKLVRNAYRAPLADIGSEPGDRKTAGRDDWNRRANSRDHEARKCGRGKKHGVEEGGAGRRENPGELGSLHGAYQDGGSGQGLHRGSENGFTHKTEATEKGGAEPRRDGT